MESPPAHNTVPTDEDGYIKSFALSEVKEIHQFLDKFGFVVVRDILSPQECEETIDDIWNFIKNLEMELKIDRHDKSTWENNRWMRTGLSSEGIVGFYPVFTRRALLNRQNPNLYKLFVNLFGKEELLINQDRYGLFRATKSGENSRNDWKTRRNIHFDMNPWTYIEETSPDYCNKVLASLKYQETDDFIIENNEIGCFKDGKLNLQALINLADNKEEDGGFQLIPGFHHKIQEWVRATRETTRLHYSKRQTFVILPDDEPIVDSALRVTARAGSVIVWNQLVAHGSAPNNSERCRYAQFIKVFPAEPMDEKRRTARAEAVKKWVKKVGCESEITSLGRKFLGLEKWN